MGNHENTVSDVNMVLDVALETSNLRTSRKYYCDVEIDNTRRSARLQ
jgi:hypothetical protein